MRSTEPSVALMVSLSNHEGLPGQPVAVIDIGAASLNGAVTRMVYGYRRFITSVSGS